MAIRLLMMLKANFYPKFRECFRGMFFLLFMERPPADIKAVEERQYHKNGQKQQLLQLSFAEVDPERISSGCPHSSCPQTFSYS